MKNKVKYLLKHTYFIDYSIFLLLLIVCIILFGHLDLYVTAQRALCYVRGGWTTIWGNLKDNIVHFYRNTVMLSGDYGTNYLPTTFLIFAVWNIPLKIISDTPTIWGEWSLLFRVWNMMLPILVYGVSGKLFLDICDRCFYMDTNKRKFILILFWGSPIAFYSQFIFTQYDIFTVCFMLLGIRSYLDYFCDSSKRKKDWFGFIFSFALATSCKYYALIVFLVLLILKEKNIIKIITNSILSSLVCVAEIAFYIFLDKEYFKSNVFGFGVLEYVNNSSINVGFASIKLLPLCICILLLYAYFQKINTNQELVTQVVFCCCSICAILFGLLTWHPQWLIFAVPFWCLAIVSSKHSELLLILDIVFCFCFVAFTSQKFVNNADQNLFDFGFLSELFRYRYDLPVEKVMARFFPFDSDLIFTAMVAIMIAYCICTYPAKTKINIPKGPIKKYKMLIRIRFACGVLTFVIAACLCIPDLLRQDEYLWTSWISDEEYQETSYLSQNNENIVQYISGISHQINYITIGFSVEDEIPDDAEINLKIMDVRSNQIKGMYTLSYDQIKGQSSGTFVLNGLDVEYDKQYALIFNSNIENTFKIPYLTYEPGMVRNDIHSIKGRHEDEFLILDDIVINNATLQMSIVGRYH